MLCDPTTPSLYCAALSCLVLSRYFFFLSLLLSSLFTGPPDLPVRRIPPLPAALPPHTTRAQARDATMRDAGDSDGAGVEKEKAPAPAEVGDFERPVAAVASDIDLALCN